MSFLPIDRVTIKQFAAISGYTEAAVRAKIEQGVWGMDDVWFRALDGRILISISGYERWVDHGKGARSPRNRQEFAG